MAAGTGAGNSSMIDSGVGPVTGDVAVIAGINAGDMCGRFTRCGSAVVAADAGASNRCMVDSGIGPVTGDVAVITAVGRGNMVR